MVWNASGRLPLTYGIRASKSELSWRTNTSDPVSRKQSVSSYRKPVNSIVQRFWGRIQGLTLQRCDESPMPLVTSFFRLPGRWRRHRARQARAVLQIALAALLALVILPLYIIYRPPVFIINILQRHSPQVLYHVPSARKVVALTIDDGPSPYTSQILEVLKENRASATFFIIGGQVIGNENLLQDILQTGSELGNHAMHDEPSINLSSDMLATEINQVDHIIERAYKSDDRIRTAKYFRPGSGIFSKRILEVARNASYRTILGSIYPHDPFIPHWRINAWHILGSLRPGAVIICHDRRSWTVPMLQKVIPEIKRRGYEIVTVSGLLDASNNT